MRISTNMIYNNSMRYMNTSLSRLAEANEQNATQKRINRPSDDPAGYAEARSLDAIMARMDQYSANIGVAETWLAQADSTLLEASTLMTSIKGLAEQAATETMTAENREQVAMQVRELFEQMITVANASVTGQSLFAGQKTGSAAFRETLFATVQDDTLTDAAVLEVAGASDHSIAVQFTGSGTVGGASDIAYRYSSDGGDTWTTGTLAAGSDTLNLGGVTVRLASGASLTATAEDGSEGTSLFVRPSAVYLGDDQDGAAVRTYGSGQVSASADGVFSANVTVRIDSNASIPGPYSYSYSLDGGLSWVDGQTASGARLPVPGGFLDIASGAGNTLASGDQFTIVPNTASISVEISPAGSVVINNVGKDVFGGLYQADGASNASPVFASDPEKNLFETIGKLIGYLENNNSDGIGQCLEDLEASQAHLETCAADVGARENRLEYAQNTVDILRDNAETRLSAVEDADLSTLMLELAKYQYAYSSVLSSSSKIIGMSLLDYI
ncbi:Flagellar hook-associated protein 3 [Fundidesulfovibrio magnetotacticus]|uniref:Flagellar hook-associated protein 3 n=1 Tax=Fundidesulfovibrio magnetotacticus TaxID=2730080 RepID=A0A6V8LXJ3_9BACT|nr:flagellar hook-associated protein FlgL [Fundidesulfovibrio magnetotacticus]GFK94367.1 Flagellar hook-associated protein 3 [Fundidesulfovibrio magnetotacticus]